jgi:hypothetical protein
LRSLYPPVRWDPSQQNQVRSVIILCSPPHTESVDLPRPVRYFVRRDFSIHNSHPSERFRFATYYHGKLVLLLNLPTDLVAAQILIHRHFIPTPGKQSTSKVCLTHLVDCQPLLCARPLRQAFPRWLSAQMQRGRVVTSWLRKRGVAVVFCTIQVSWYMGIL